jgi:hypothetical protein
MKDNEVQELFRDIGKIYGVDADEVEDIFYSILEKYFETDNIILDGDKLYVNGYLYEYFDLKEIKRFRGVLEDNVQKYSIEKLKNYFEMVLRQKTKIKAILEKEGKRYYYFKPFLDGAYNDYLKIQVPKTNVKFDFAAEKDNEFIIYLPKKIKVFRKNKSIYFNKYFIPGKVITKETVKNLIKDKIVTAFSVFYTVDDFKVRYISPVKQKYGIINITIKKQISANLLTFLDNVFKRYGYIVNLKEKKKDV